MADILIIDDDSAVCNCLELMLQRYLAGDHEIQTYTDVWTVPGYASATPPLLRSSDYVNGMEVASNHRNDPPTRPCRFIFVPTYRSLSVENSAGMVIIRPDLETIDD